MLAAEPISILFGGPSRERLVSVATAQALHAALPDANLWFWDIDNTVYDIVSEELLAHTQVFEVPFRTEKKGFGNIDQALDQAKEEGRVMVFGLHGGPAENGELPLMCETRGLAFTGAGSSAGNIGFNKGSAKRFAELAGLSVLPNIDLSEMEEGLSKYETLIAKPLRDGSSYGLIVVRTKDDIETVRTAAKLEDYLVEPFIVGVEATCGVLEKSDGSVIALPPIETITANGVLDYTAKYLAPSTQDICPGRFTSVVSKKLMDHAVAAHKAMSCAGYSRSDFIVKNDDVIFLELNTMPGLSRASAYPVSLRAEGISFADFLAGQIALARKRAGKPYRVM